VTNTKTRSSHNNNGHAARQTPSPFAGYESQHNGNDEAQPRITAVPWPAPISKIGHYGIAGEYVELVAQHTEGDPNAILLAFLTYAGNLVGRNFYVAAGPERHHPNLYLCLVGSTAAGRKGSAIAAAEKFFTAGTFPPTLPQIVAGISTAEGAIWKVKDAFTKRQYDKNENRFVDLPAEEAVTDKRILFKLTEFQQALVSMRKRESALSAILRQGWDGTTLEVPSKNSPTKATGAHVSLIAAITKQELLSETNAVDAHNGLLNRFLFCCCQRAHLLPEGEVFDGLTTTREWADLQKRFQSNIAKATEAELVIRRSAEAQKEWGLNAYPNENALYHKLSRPRPGLYGQITARAPQQVIRVSLTQAIINGHRKIETEAQDSAWECSRFTDDSCRFIWGDTADPTTSRILDALRGSADGLTRTDINCLFFNHHPAEVIERSLAWLSHQGLAYSKTLPTRGRPVETWFATL
jgi:hypothetical protein